MIDDYLYNEEVQLFPTPPKKSATNSILKQKEIRKQARRKSSKQLKNQRSRLLYQKQSYNRNLNKEFSGLFKENKKVETSASSILKGVQDILGFVMIAGISLFSLQKILEGTGKLAEGQTAFDLLKPSTYGKGEASGKSSGKISEKGLNLIRNKEALYLYPYDDANKKYPHPEIKPGDKVYGTLTIGYGHTGKDVKPGMRITKEQAESMLRNDVTRFENTVNKHVKVPISQNMFDALVVFCYNVGPGAFANSTLLKKLNKGDYKGAQQEFMVWNKVTYTDKKTGKKVTTVSKGLDERRRAEAELFGIDISSDNKLSGQVINEEVKPVTKTSGGISDNYGGAYNIKSGSTIGNYTMKDSQGKDLIMSGQMEEFLKEVSSSGGYGNVTSVMDGKHAGDKYNAGSHYSGNKVDIGLRGLDQEAIIKQCIPIMRHPALVHVSFEGLGKNDADSKRISKEIEKKIRSRYPDIDKRLKNREFAIYHWGWKYAKSPHLDIRINPNKLKNVPKSKLQSNVNQENKNKPKEVPKTKPKNKVETKVNGKVKNSDITLQQSPPQKKNQKIIDLNKVDPNKLKYQENQSYLKKGK